MILAVTGLQRERRIVAGPGVEAVAGGGDHARLEAVLDRLAAGARGIISIGIAGALAPGLQAGQWVVADAVLVDGESIPTDPAVDGPAGRSSAARRPGACCSARMPWWRKRRKRPRCTGRPAPWRSTWNRMSRRGWRERHRLPFAAARVISDAAHRTLPPAALVGMKPDGRMDLPAVLRSLLAHPGQLPALIRTGLEAERGFRALLRCHRRLGPGLGGPDLGQLLLDMA